MNKYEETILGIDLGTTYSCIAIWRNNKIEIIPNEIGERTTPSVVYFDTNEILIGTPAKMKSKNNGNKIYDAKRLIGRNYDDKEIQEDMKYWPFKVIKDDNTNRALFEVEYLGTIKKFYPEEISAMILSKLKQNAEDFLGHEITDAIITVPAYFNNSQRQATKDAGRIAGINVVRIINEPTSAAIAYGLDNRYNEEEKYILVFDFGGGTLDVTILLLNKNIYEVKATRGNNHLGGEDFDNELVKICIKEFKEQTGIDISKNKKAINRLKNKCESSKIELSIFKDTFIEIDDFVDGEDLSIYITRSEFEDMCSKYFNECLAIIKQALEDANLTNKDIDEIVIVGGSSKIPKIQEILRGYFHKELNKSIHPEEAIAYGAAYIGVLVNDIDDYRLEKLVLIDVTPYSLGIGLSNGEMDVIIPKNTAIPCEKTINYRTIKDNQKKIVLKIYQGEREYSKYNTYLGKCVLNNIPPKPKGDILINVTFSININGMLDITATEKSGGIENTISLNMNYNELNDEKSGGIENTISLNMNYNRLNEEKIKELIKKNNKIIEDDKKKIESNNKRIELEETCYYYQKDGSEKQKKMALEILKWVKKNRYEEKSVYEEKLKEIKECH